MKRIVLLESNGALSSHFKVEFSKIGAYEVVEVPSDGLSVCQYLQSHSVDILLISFFYKIDAKTNKLQLAKHVYQSHPNIRIIQYHPLYSWDINRLFVWDISAYFDTDELNFSTLGVALFR
ncbi:hypothetical protein [Reichenbachiella versicolor]|uniref:hypothetical protein n=1 Tax=Reichenbachiella versicolor TaxID=1821036 RepID=UPI000D6E9015|nr:hypothetical protein [Reichenbachiella versicolor]